MSIVRMVGAAAFALSLVTLGATEASATQTYTYTGNLFSFVTGGQSTTNRVTASVTLTDTIAANSGLATYTPVSFSISDGLQTISTYYSYDDFRFGADAAGNINNWFLAAYNGAGNAYVSTSAGGAPTDQGVTPGGASVGYRLNNPGTWRTEAPTPSPPGVPEPSTWMMMIAGFGGLGALLRRRRLVGLIGA